MDTYFDGWRVIFKDLHDSHHAEGQISRGREQQWGRQAADGDQHLHLAGKQLPAECVSRAGCYVSLNKLCSLAQRRV